jgi:hypothetical protein
MTTNSNNPLTWTAADFRAAAVESYWFGFADYLRAEQIMMARETEQDTNAYMKLWNAEAECLRQCDESRFDALRYAEEAAALRRIEAQDRRIDRAERREFC